MEYECRICNKKFKPLRGLSNHIVKFHKITSEEYSIKYLNISKGICNTCGKNTKYVNLKDGYSKYCSPKCSNTNPTKKKKFINTCIKKYGVDNPSKLKEFKKKREETCMENYGVTNPNKSSVIKEKIISTCLKNYGVTNPMKSNIIKEKIVSNNIEKYGTTHFMKLEKSKDKMKTIFLEKYGKEYFLQTEEFKQTSEKTNIEKYGVDNPMKIKRIKDKQKQTMIENHGIDNPMKSDEFKKKCGDTCFKNYGVRNPMKSTIVQDKLKQTMIKNHGVDNPMKSEKIKNKLKCTIQNKYGYDYITRVPEFKEKIKKTLSKNFLEKLEFFLKNSNLSLVDKKYQHEFFNHNWKCLVCNKEFKTCWNNIQQFYKCPKCFPRYSGRSILEKEVFEYIKSVFNEDIIENSKSIIAPKELDIYIPSKRLAIEFNGLYWHSEEMLLENAKTHHLSKTEECEKQGIQLIHIFEDEWIFKKEIVKSRISSLMGISNNRIYARKCIIKEIEPSVKNKFLETNHIQGKDNSKIKLGAFYNGELVSVMTFSKGNISKGSKAIEGVWELNRFCSKLGYQVVGIASKLLSHFKKNYEWKEIFSYADRRWSVGNVYEKLGFKFLYNTTPNYWYIKEMKRIHRFGLRKRPDEPKDVPEWYLREQEGYDRIWDCGNLKFEMRNTNG